MIILKYDFCNAMLLTEFIYFFFFLDAPSDFLETLSSVKIAVVLQTLEHTKWMVLKI